MANVEVIYDQPCKVGESPVWDASTGALWWVDIVQKTMHRTHVASGKHRAWTLPEMVGCVSRAQNGQWIAAMETAIARVEFPEAGDARIIERFAVEHSSANMRCNDGRCDRQGRFIVSTMFNDMGAAQSYGVMLKLDGSGVTRFLDRSFIVGNGLAFSPDGTKMYVSDSHPTVQTVWVYDYSTDSGLAYNARQFADFKPLNGRPDGAAVDVDGCYWICANDGSAVYRFTPQGALDQTITLPVKKPSMCAFGGANLDTLYIASIRPDGIDLSDQPLAGCVFAVKTSTQGIEEPLFKF